MTEVYFTADPDGLDALNRRLANIEDNMQGLTVAVDRYEPSDLSPSGNVWNALQALNEAWSERLKVINGNVGALQQRLANASALYRRAEEKIGDAARQGTATLRQDGMLTWRAGL
jgi:hypothetical protein